MGHETWDVRHGINGKGDAGRWMLDYGNSDAGRRAMDAGFGNESNNNLFMMLELDGGVSI